MLAVKDRNYVVWGDSFKLAKRFNMREKEVITGLQILQSPDTRRIGPQEFEGRRIESVEGGWKLLNGEKYRNLISTPERRAKKAQWQANWRAKQKKLNGGKTPKTRGQIRAENDSRERRHGNAANEEEEGKIAAENLPDNRNEDFDLV